MVVSASAFVLVGVWSARLLEEQAVASVSVLHVLWSLEKNNIELAVRKKIQARLKTTTESRRGSRKKEKEKERRTGRAEKNHREKMRTNERYGRSQSKSK